MKAIKRLQFFFMPVLLLGACMTATDTRGGTVVQVFSGTNAGAVTLAVFNPALGKLVEARFSLTNAYTGPATYMWPYPQSATLLTYSFNQSLLLGLTLNSFAPQPTTFLNAYVAVVGPERVANLPLVQDATFFVPPEAAGLTAGLAYAPGDFSGGQTAMQTAFTTPPIHLGTESRGRITSLTEPLYGDPQPQTPISSGHKPTG